MPVRLSRLFGLFLCGLPLCGLTGCTDGSGPYAVEDAGAEEGTADLPAGAVERALNPGEAGTVGDEEDEEVVPEGTAGDGVSVRPVSYDELRAVIAAADGPVLVDCWATWCVHCREAFPHTVALAEEHAGEGLTVISLAFDPEEKEGEIEAFLTEQRAAGLTNLRTADGGESPQWNPLGGMSLPVYLIFDADGAEVARVVGGGEAKAAELDAAVRAALGA